MPSRLTEIDKSHFCAILRMGCDRATACMRLGITPGQLRIELAMDEDFAKNLARSAAEIELEHMRNLRKASEDFKNWRASQWWLERRAPQRYAPRSPAAISAEDLEALFDQLAKIILDETPQPELAATILDRLERPREAASDAGGGPLSAVDGFADDDPPQSDDRPITDSQ
ncbi:MAG: hypothetical protein IT424_08725 [Pirellulales bacterium]|nr:hypothetical protein [Pirellulales bacterium]